MSKTGLVALLFLMSGRSPAQEDRSVLIQADYNQPFSARLGEKTFSSSPKGHLILSQLKDSTYSIMIEFPKNVYPEQQFSFTVNYKDLDLQLKDLGDKGWGLFNSQPQEVKTVDKKESQISSQPEGIKKDDAFSRLMAGVVGDTAVMYNNTYGKEEFSKDSPIIVNAVSTAVDSPKMVSAVDKESTTTMIDSSKMLSAPIFPAQGNSDLVKPSPVISGDSSLGKTDTSKQLSISGAVVLPGVGDAANAVVYSPLHQVSKVLKLSERKTAKGLRLAFADHIKGRKADTVIVIIPVDTGMQIVKHQYDTTHGGINPNSVSENGSRSGQASSLPTASGQASPINKSVSSTQSGGNETSEAGMLIKPDSAQKKARSKIVLINSDCRNFASDYDVDKLRVKMLEAGKDEDRITVALKVFRSKCFTTKQIRALSEVFATDAFKFKFLETAYPFVSDDRFRDLSDLLTDPVYSNKFKSMISPK